jgi:hypothetical protein
MLGMRCLRWLSTRLPTFGSRTMTSRTGQAAGKRLQEVATYPTMTRSLLGMCDRLRQVGVTRVVMEATSDYWKPPFYLLEAADLADHGRVSPRPGRQVDAAADAMPGRQHDSCLLATHRQTTAVTMI